MAVPRGAEPGKVLEFYHRGTKYHAKVPVGTKEGGSITAEVPITAAEPPASSGAASDTQSAPRHDVTNPVADSSGSGHGSRSSSKPAAAPKASSKAPTVPPTAAAAAQPKPPTPACTTAPTANAASSTNGDHGAAGIGGWLSMGQVVYISGLSQRPELNGRPGRGVMWDSIAGRYHVQTEAATKPLALRPANLVSSLRRGGAPMGTQATQGARAAPVRSVLSDDWVEPLDDD